MKKRLSLTISGKVQGVSFRYYSQEKAQELDLLGWVRNNKNSTVTMVAEGEESNLKKLLNWCQSGPSAAQITGINSSWSSYQGQFSNFEVKYNN